MPETYFVHDQDCGFCQRWAAWAIGRGAQQRLQFVPRRDAEPLLLRVGVTPESTLRAATLIVFDDAGHGYVYTGAAAINGLLSRLPGPSNRFFRGIAVLYHLPIIHQLQDAIYPVIAKYRHHLFKSACPVVLPNRND